MSLVCLFLLGGLYRIILHLLCKCEQIMIILFVYYSHYPQCGISFGFFLLGISKHYQVKGQTLHLVLHGIFYMLLTFFLKKYIYIYRRGFSFNSSL